MPSSARQLTEPVAWGLLVVASAFLVWRAYLIQSDQRAAHLHELLRKPHPESAAEKAADVSAASRPLAVLQTGMWLSSSEEGVRRTRIMLLLRDDGSFDYNIQVFEGSVAIFDGTALGRYAVQGHLLSLTVSRGLQGVGGHYRIRSASRRELVIAGAGGEPIRYTHIFEAAAPLPGVT